MRRDQLLRAGLTRHQIQTYVNSGLLTAVLPGIYVVGVPTLSHHEFLRGGLLYAGPSAQLVSRTAGEVGAVLRPRLGKAVVSPSARGNRRILTTAIPVDETGAPGELEIRPSRSLAAPFSVGALAISPLARALVDIAAEPDGERVLGWAWEEAEYRSSLDLDAIRAEVAAGRRPGLALVKARLAKHQVVTDANTDLRSKRELRFLHVMAAHGLPRPDVNVRTRVAGRWSRPDFLWRWLRFALEFDGPGHQRPSVRARDLMSDIEYFLDDLHVIRFPTEEALADPVHYVGVLAEALDHRARQLGIRLEPFRPTDH